MGIMDMFQEVGSSLLNAIVQTQKPGEFCITECNISDTRCEACLAEQEKIRAAVEELRNLESAFENAGNDPQAAEKKRITKCSLCGAPIDKSEQSCPYCSEPYPAGAVTVDIPTSKIEQDNILLQKASEIYNMYADLKKRIYDSNGNDMKDKLPGFLGGAASVLFTATNNLVDMTPQDIKKVANQNGISYCDYVVGVMQRVYQSAGEIYIQQVNDRLTESSQKSWERQQERNERSEKRKREYEEMRQQRQETYERNRQIEAERRAKIKAIRDEQHARELERIKNSAPQYGTIVGGGGGGSSHCCGNCVYYMTGDNKCGRDTYKRITASDSCGWFKWK